MHCAIIPPYLLDALQHHADQRVRAAARRSLLVTQALRSHPSARIGSLPTHRRAVVRPKRRLVYDCGETRELPGHLVRREGDPAVNDIDANRAYAAAGTTHDFYATVFHRDSIDGYGMHLISSVHYGRDFDNAFWDGAQMVYGDGDGVVFSDFTSCLDVVAHELTHGLAQTECALVYEGESGALSESLSDVFGTLVKQWSLGQNVHDADWLIGRGMFAPGIAGVALRSLAAPGTAYDDPALGGRDPQPWHMRDYVDVRTDHGDVHLNSGIPNHAFYRFAKALGGNAWETAGHVWYDALRSGLHRRCGFKPFAESTLAAAERYGSHIASSTRAAWHAVGVLPRAAPHTQKPSHSKRPACNGKAQHADDGREYVGVRGHVITAAIAILADGTPRTSEEICTEALARGLVPPGTSKRYVYTALIEYIARTKGHDRKPAIVQDPDRRFRANHPPDPWPMPSDAPAAPSPSPATLAALARARTAAHGRDPAAFEEAICDVFASLGFAATHIGGQSAPDGYLDAPLGPLAYRVMLECKTASANAVVAEPNVVEAAKYRTIYGATYCALIGPAFGAETAFASELRTHGVSAWTLDDLESAAHAGFNPATLRALFVPGLVADVIDDVIWNAAHGEAKRVAVICDALESIAVRQQRIALAGTPADAPLLDRDAAMMLLDEHLAASGSVARCTRVDIDAAFAWLTHPRVRRAIWTSDDQHAIVITAALVGGTSTGAASRKRTVRPP